MALKLRRQYKSGKYVLFLAKEKGGKTIFDPSVVKPEEYVYYKGLGFNIFECSTCFSPKCDGDCGNVQEVIEIDDEEIEIEETETTEETANEITEETADEIDESDEELDSLEKAEEEVKNYTTDEKKCAKCDAILTDKRRKYCDDCK